MTLYNTIIIGGGPAAMSAAIYAARHKLNFMIIAKEIGGQITWSNDVENYPGYHSISGLKLATLLRKHVEANGVKISTGNVKNIEKTGKNFIVETDSKKYETKTVLIASGKKPRMLGIPGEEKYQKRGVAYCAICDGPIFSGMNVAVIGGGNAALDAALMLERYTKKVYLITLNDKLFGEPARIHLVEKSKKINVLYNVTVKEFIGDGKKITQIKFDHNNDEKTFDVSGIFVEIGSVPSVDFDNLTKKNSSNEIIIHEENGMSNMTSVNGIFAAGDVTNIPEKQVIVAAGEGAKATLGVFKYLNSN